MSFKGSCLCGAVRYEIDGFDLPVRHCHCRTCRKAHAAAFNTSVHVSRDRFRWISGETNLTSFESSPGKFRQFCSACGSPIVAEYPDRRYVTVRIATLDEDPGVRPEYHNWLSNAAPWLTASEPLPSHEDRHLDR